MMDDIDPMPERILPKRPDPPPLREFRTGFFRSVETEESKRATAEWRAYIRGYGEGMAAGQVKRA